jgi:hypothetical protein
MRCARCHKNQAAIHFTPVADGEPRKTVHLCKDCAPAGAKSHVLDPAKLEPLSIATKRCEFCGRRARHAGVLPEEKAFYFCLGCGKEFARIIGDLSNSERIRLMERERVEGTVLFQYRDTPEVQAWWETANRKAMETLTARRRQLPLWRRWAARMARLCP